MTTLNGRDPDSPSLGKCKESYTEGAVLIDIAVAPVGVYGPVNGPDVASNVVVAPKACGRNDTKPAPAGNGKSKFAPAECVKVENSDNRTPSDHTLKVEPSKTTRLVDAGT